MSTSRLDQIECPKPKCRALNPINHNFCYKCRERLSFAGHYKVIEFLGQGSFGRAFLAQDEHRLDSKCVIKEFCPDPQNIQGAAALGKAKELFKQEAFRLNELGKHPQIPDLLSFFEQNDKLYLVQEFIEGQDLAAELRKRGPYNEAEIRQFFNDLLPVFDYIHQRQVIHRDVKLENIMRRQDGVLFLIDFGISKQASGTVLGKPGTTAGSPSYAPVEQMLQGVVYPCSDLYSLAVCAIRLLTGCLPKTAHDGSIIDDLFDIKNYAWVWYDRVIVSEELRQVLDKMLQVWDVDQRYPSAVDVMQALNASQVVAEEQRLAELAATKQREEEAIRQKLITREVEKQVHIVKRQAEKEKNNLIQQYEQEKRQAEQEKQSLIQQYKQGKQSLTQQYEQEKRSLLQQLQNQQSVAKQLEADKQRLMNEVATIKQKLEQSGNKSWLSWLTGNQKGGKLDHIPLNSAKGIDYTKLRDLLAAQKWEEADLETLNVMLKAAGRKKENYFTIESIDNFPCKDLRTIDQLWVASSNGRFGFSVQKEIWLECGGKVDWETECKLADRVQWRKEGKWQNYSDLTFDLSATPGHLPAMAEASAAYLGGRVIAGRIWAGQGGASSLAQRLVTCKIS